MAPRPDDDRGGANKLGRYSTRVQQPKNPLKFNKL